ncbi:pre-peptidase C-terminal domain-containing protein [Bifidobacterium tibiigranuli]|jgi:hypothetical protein|uniref:Uncharacterized protein n=1 Tax=Bifidobacterium tibiigranuli TaxID=2172043 RepID=A0A5N6S5C8_9BIFI|nr:pre-peptidase C-terminal domain-containing protein [Bifidobacterium tibiigranuli]KAE8126890.1 hypothetical protein DDE84_09475 [Bifidobacterium tibiigranuli]KAE8129822.1 hypothetical protein DDF78_01720 [Bifidobacterium tibiigranuli]MCI1649869.1 pre-peptidase C-terminal domain-containing protein [Bifidobacterium tibiigranuli]MCI1674524.1 pre-peptidase C-terminal domain-containing protein [Bifidobacterium tibiigranuli]MCI1713234.1 pre-peptidase C-terminal domain-containing protein [Bifidobac
MKKRFAAVLATAAMLVAGAFVAPSASADTGNTSDTAKAIAVNTTVSGAVGTDYGSYDNNWFKYTIPAKGKVWISGSNLSDPDVRLFTSAGSTQQHDDNGAASDVHRFPAGTYYVRIQAWFPKTSYTLRVNYVNEGSKLTEVEPDNNPSAATPVKLNTFYAGNIASGSDTDWFKYTVPAKGSVRLDMNTNTDSGDYVLSMYTSPGGYADYDPVDYVRCSSGSGYCNTPAHSLAAGTYYVKVNAGYSWDDADYQLKVSYTPATPAPAPAPKPTSKPTPAGKGTPVPVYRVYNKNSGLHHYTTSLGEKDALVKLGWKYEGVSFNAAKQGSASGLVPVYREYNPHNGNHNWTLNQAEHNKLVSLGWRSEGVAWYANPAGPVTVYRLYNPHSGEHVYTTSATEYAAVGKAGWHQEGTAWKGL